MKTSTFEKVLSAALAAVLLTGCGGTANADTQSNTPAAENNTPAAENNAPADDADSENTPSSGEVTIVHAVGNNNYYPLVFLDDDGEMKGYAVDVNNAVFDLLPDYEFQLEASSGDAILMGLEQGNYDIAIGGFYWNADREQKFIFPEFSGGSIEGIVTTPEHANVKSFEEAIAQGLKIAPTLAGGGLIGALIEYNENNPDNPLDYDIIDERQDADIYLDVLNGRYDYDFTNRHTWNKIVADNPDSDIAERTVFNSVTAVKAYDLFNKNKQDIADAYSEAIKQLREDGTLSEIYVKWFGEDVFPLLDENKK